MNVVVDTSIWSLAYRRRAVTVDPSVAELAELIREDRAVMMGPVRQELLSGLRDELQFQRLRTLLRPFTDLRLEADDYESAAAFCNACRAHGLQGSNTDFLICAAAVRRQCRIFTTDEDFPRFAKVLPIKLHRPRA